MNKRKKLPVSFLLIFIIAILVAFFVSSVLPVPSKFNGLVFFATVIAVSFAGVFIYSVIKKRRR